MPELDVFVLRAFDGTTNAQLRNDIESYDAGEKQTEHSVIAPLGPFLPGLIGGLHFSVCGEEGKHGFEIVTKTMDFIEPVIQRRGPHDWLIDQLPSEGIVVPTEVERPDPDEEFGDWTAWQLPPTLIDALAKLTTDEMASVAKSWMRTNCTIWWRGPKDRSTARQESIVPALRVLRALAQETSAEKERVFIVQRRTEVASEWVSPSEWGRPQVDHESLVPEMIARGASTTTAVSCEPAAPATVVATRTTNLRHLFHLRPDFQVEVLLPLDITPDEAARLALFLRSLPMAGAGSISS